MTPSPLLHLFATILCLAALAPDRLVSQTTGDATVLPSPVAVDCDPGASAEWLCSLLTAADGSLLFAGKTANRFQDARLPFKGPTEVRFAPSRGIVVDQEGAYPVVIASGQGGWEFTFETPLHALADEKETAEGLPEIVADRKSAAVTTKGFRLIAQRLHTHLTKILGGLPECHRVRDDGEGWPSERYIWTAKSVLILLTAYKGNDSDGLLLAISSIPGTAERIRKMKRTTEPPFGDWGESLPAATNEGK